MSIPGDIVEEVRAASDIVDIVGDYVRLKKRGTNYVGLCPFHNEKTPSFNVNPGMGIFKCFGCGAGGDAFQFIMRTENLGFPEAVRVLAEKASIHIPEADAAASERALASEPVYNALRFAARYYFNRLTQTAEGKRGLDYLRGRGFSGATIKRFGLGYAPDAWDGLVSDAEKNHVSVEALEMAGLVIRRDGGNGCYDRYRDRVIFPIFSNVGKVLGFGGRVLEGGAEQAKYINSPETEVYSKSKVLYGLYHGKQAIRRSEEALLVEGYTDVISLQQAGIENAVAVCGTSLTEGHVKALTRYAKRIIFLNDSDAAGEHATVRGIGLALAGGLTPYVVELPKGEDPDSFAQKNERGAVEEYLRDKRWSFVVFLAIRARREGRMDQPESETAAINEILAQIAALDDPVARDAYIGELSRVLKKPDILLYTAFERVLAEQSRSRRRSTPARDTTPADRAPVDDPDTDETPEGQGGSELPQRRRESLPEEQVLIRIMLEQGNSLVEYVLGHAALSDFTDGPSRDTVNGILELYHGGNVEPQPFLEGKYGGEVRNFVAEALIDQFEVSENWARRHKIVVPKLNQDPYGAAASAIKLLKLDRIDQAVSELQQRRERMPRESAEFLAVSSDIVGLRTLRETITSKGLADWNSVE